MKRLIRVLAHPRSGTGYMAALLKANGLDVRHEEMGEHGISSWMFAVQTDKVPFTFDDSTPVDYDFQHTLHVLREPISAISSIYHTEHGSLEWRAKWMCLWGNRMEKAVSSYIGWNKLILGLDPVTFKLEHTESILDWLNGNGLCETREKVQATNTREHEKLTLEDIQEAINPTLFKELDLFIKYYNEI